MPTHDWVKVVEGTATDNSVPYTEQVVVEKVFVAPEAQGETWYIKLTMLTGASQIQQSQLLPYESEEDRDTAYTALTDTDSFVEAMYLEHGRFTGAD